MGYTKKSPWVIHYDGSSCNGCDIEVLATLCPGFDAERFGVINTGNPKHADIFLVTGSVNEQNKGVIKQIYEQMLEPKVVVACGICACSGGIFKDCYNVLGGVDKVIPVDAYVPGCAVRPESLIDAVVAGVEILDKKEAELKANNKLKNKNKPETSEEKTSVEENSSNENIATEQDAKPKHTVSPSGQTDNKEEDTNVKDESSAVNLENNKPSESAKEVKDEH